MSITLNFTDEICQFIDLFCLPSDPVLHLLQFLEKSSGTKTKKRMKHNYPEVSDNDQFYKPKNREL